MGSALLVERSLLDDQAPAVIARLTARGVVVVPLDPPFSLRALRVALNGVGASGGWLVCRDANAVSASATAGLSGVVLIGCAVPADDCGIVVAEARDLADAPRVMEPRGGGCWHDLK